MSDHRKLLSLTTAAAALAALFASPAMAQQSNAAQEEGAVAEEDEIVVIGTQIRGAAPVGSDPVVISQEEAARTGLANVADIVRRMPQVQMGVGDNVGFQGGTSHQGYNQAQTETINLRGLGAASTLILVDGRRVVGAGAISTITEANQVPLAALSRLEILPDGASAVYGSDAVAGVVNFVTRRDFDGVDVTLRYGNQSGGDEYGVTLVGGTVWENALGDGNLLVTYEHLDREAFTAGEIARLRRDLTSIGGPDMRINDDDATVGFSPNIISASAGLNTIPTAGTWTYWGVPEGNGVGLVAGDLLLNDPNLAETSHYRDWTGEQVRDQLAVHFNQDLAPGVEVFGSLSYANRETVSRAPTPSVRIALAGTPYAIAGLPADQTVQYSTLKDGQVRTFASEAETIGTAIGIRAELPNDWQAEAFFNYGRNEQCDSCVTGAINRPALTAQIQAGNINPLSSEPLTAAERALVYGSSEFRSRTTLEDLVVKFDGPLFDLPAGPVRAAVGGEMRIEANANENVSRTGVTNTLTQISTYGSTEYDRSIESFFVELNVPVVDSSMNIPLVESLTLSAAGRYDNYSDVGSTTNPRFGFTWEMNDMFSLRGSWGTSFRAPSVTDVNPNTITSGTNLLYFNTNPDITNSVPPFFIFPGQANFALMLGANPGLEPEESENWSVTAGFEHEGLDIGVTYWNISFDRQIAFPGTIAALFNAPFNPAFAAPGYGGWSAFIIPVNNPLTCDNSDITTADPVLQEFLETVNYDFVSGGGDFGSLSSLRDQFCQVNAIADSRIQNIANVQQSGLDFNVSYFREVGEVDLQARLAASQQLEHEISSQPGTPGVDQIGDINVGGFEWRGTASVTALWRGFDATLGARYLHDMVASQQANADGTPGGPDRDLDAHTEFDLTLGYTHDFGESGFAGLNGWRAQLAVTNVTDEYPDFFVNTDSAEGAPAWNTKYGLPFGRTYSVTLSARF